jgi:hypothetical protein
MRKMFTRPASAQEGPGAGTALAEPPVQHASVLRMDGCDHSGCPASAQVAIATAAGSLGFCVHHGRVIFDQMVLLGLSPAEPRHIGDIKPWT